MGRAPCCEKEGLRKGAWSADEDERLAAYIARHGHANWRALPKNAGLLRCGKSCRLRWINYLRPDIKRGNFTADEEDRIVHLHKSIGNRWSAIAAQLPGRTDNEIKNVWHSHLKKRLEECRRDTAGAGVGSNQGEGKCAAGDHEQLTAAASPGRSTSSGLTCSTGTESAAAVSSSSSSPPPRAESTAITSASHGRVKEDRASSAAVIDESFWSSTVMTGVIDLGAMDEELTLTARTSSTRNEDMEFWHRMLLEAGDMRDLTVL